MGAVYDDNTDQTMSPTSGRRNDAAKFFQEGLPFYEAAEKLDKHALSLIRKSAQKLSLGCDPFDLPIRRHRALQGMNENAYSDWLAWIIELSGLRGRDALGFCQFVFDGSADPTTSMSTSIPEVGREERANAGHEGHAGRHDILVRFELARILWHIEVKITHADQSDLHKNNGYKKSIDKAYPEYNHKHYVLALGFGRPLDWPYEPICWENLCVRIRSWIANQDEPGTPEAIMLLFCGIVEQRLLDIGKGSAKQRNYLTDFLGVCQ